MIKCIEYNDIDRCVNVIRNSFATVAADFCFTEQNCPHHTSFIKNENLHNRYDNGCHMFGYFDFDEIIAYVSLSKNGDTSYQIQNLAVLPKYRHKGYGKELLEFCKNKVKEFGGDLITINIIEQNTRLKDWYTDFGFVHTGTEIFNHLPYKVGFMKLEIL